MKCQHCGEEIENGAQFCPYCGRSTKAPVRTTVGTNCKSCQAPVEADVTFCADCGAPLIPVTGES